MIDLITTGYNCRGKTYNFKIHKLICDAPAKAAVLNIMSHTGYYRLLLISYTKCTVREVNKPNCVYFINAQATLRSDEDFWMQTQVKHHRDILLLTLISHFDPIFNVPLDYMHLICLEVMQKMLLI